MIYFWAQRTIFTPPLFIAEHEQSHVGYTNFKKGGLGSYYQVQPRHILFNFIIVQALQQVNIALPRTYESDRSSLETIVNRFHLFLIGNYIRYSPSVKVHSIILLWHLPSVNFRNYLTISMFVNLDVLWIPMSVTSTNIKHVLQSCYTCIYLAYVKLISIKLSLHVWANYKHITLSCYYL
jgi:hypothetical protein